MTGRTFDHTSLLVVGAGPAGLACAIAARKASPDLEICVIDKGAEVGNHNLSGAVLEPGAVERLLELGGQAWRDDAELGQILARRVERDDVLFLPGRSLALSVSPAIRLAALLGLGFGQMRHTGDYIVSVSRLAGWLGRQARAMGIEVLTGFAAVEVLLAADGSRATGVRLVERGLDKEGRQQPNYAAGETVEAEAIVLAEGCDGLASERFVQQAGLRRRTGQLYSIGVKEVVKVTEEQYARFGDRRVVHALGYPVWTPALGPGMFGGGLAYSYGDGCIAVGMIVGLDWAEQDFNPQDALTHFKNHAYMRGFVADGKVIEAGAKMIPEGGYHAVPRDPVTNAIGKANVLLVGDSAGLVNMLKIKGLHCALDSGRLAGEAAAAAVGAPLTAAQAYTERLERSTVMRELRQARHYRQFVARCGNLVGLPLSAAANALPLLRTEPDFRAMRRRRYRLKGNKEFDKDTFTALAHTEHREDQPPHLQIVDPGLCAARCVPTFGAPCITFCPAGVYEDIQGVVKAANASNCLHCKTCQRKCPLDNIRWNAPEGGGGPRYRQM